MAGENIRTARYEQTKNGPGRHVALLSTNKVGSEIRGQIIKKKFEEGVTRRCD
jgi:hypothetical protein